MERIIYLVQRITFTIAALLAVCLAALLCVSQVHAQEPIQVEVWCYEGNGSNNCGSLPINAFLVWEGTNGSSQYSWSFTGETHLTYGCTICADGKVNFPPYTYIPALLSVTSNADDTAQTSGSGHIRRNTTIIGLVDIELYDFLVAAPLGQCIGYAESGDYSEVLYSDVDTGFRISGDVGTNDRSPCAPAGGVTIAWTIGTSGNYCADGEELLESPYELGPLDALSVSGVSSSNAAQLRYTLVHTASEAIAGSLVLQDNPSLYDFSFSGSAEVISATVPVSSAFTLYRIPGTNTFRANVDVENTGANAFTVASLCLLEPQVNVGDYCADGTELLTEEVFLDRQEGNSWSWRGSLPYNTFALRYRLENPEPEGTTIYAIANINGETFVIKPPIGSTVITSTVPATGALDGPSLETTLSNGYDSFTLKSVCAIEAIPKPRYGDCTYFYDFTEGIEPWEKIPGTGANWAEDEENGALRILSNGSGGDATALVPLPAGTWEMRFSARSYTTSSVVTFGLVGSEFPYTDTLRTATLDGTYQQLSASGIVSGYAQIASQAVMVDWVCLYNANDDGAIGGPLLPVPSCGVFPTFADHPDFEITQIGNWIYWLVQKVGEILTWLICKIVEAVNSAINWLVTQIYRIMGNLDLPTMPDFPENLFDLRGWLEWYRQSYNAILQWFWRNWRNGLQSIKNILLWLWQFWTGGLDFMGSLWLRGVELLLEHVLAFFGIAADVDLLGLFRDGRIFLQNIRYEVQLEFESLLTLLDETAEVFEVLFIGWSGALSGNVQADFGENMGGLGAFIWKGVDWVGEAIDGTPLTALNIISLGILAWGLITYTVATISRILEKLFTLG